MGALGGILLAGLLFSGNPRAEQAGGSCTAGPSHWEFGGTPWLVYACDDGRSVVAVSAPGSAASPFYFVISWGPLGLELRGEGTGPKAATDPAYEELKHLRRADVAALYEGAQAAGGAGQPR